MYSSEDLERFYFQYQTEALPHGESLQSFCVKNKVPYNIFQKWYRDTRKKVVEVQIDGIPIADSGESPKPFPKSQAVSERRTVTLPICVVNTAVCCLLFVNGFTGNPMMGMFLINNSAGMAENQKDRYIQYLAEQNQDLRLTSDAMELVLEDFMAEMKELKDQMVVFESNQADLQKELSEKSKLCKSLERKLKSTQEKLAYANEQLFGDKRQKVKPKPSKGKSKKADSDRQREKDDYDGTNDTHSV